MHLLEDGLKESRMELPKRMSKLDNLYLQDLFGSKHGIWAVAIQAKFFEYLCEEQLPLAKWFSVCFLELMEFATAFARGMVSMNEVPLLANSSHVFYSGSSVEMVRDSHLMKRCFTSQLEALKIEALLVKEQISVAPLREVCDLLSQWCFEKKQTITE